MPRAICAKCAVEMEIEKNDFSVKDVAMNTIWRNFPATVWFGDKYKCPKCDWEVVIGFGSGMEDTDDTYKADLVFDNNFVR